MRDDVRDAHYRLGTTYLPTISDEQLPKQGSPFLNLGGAQLPARTIPVYTYGQEMPSPSIRYIRRPI